MKSTNWKDIAELIGLVAIVASLIAVTLELRQTQTALTAATYQARAFDSIAGHHNIADSEYLLGVLVETDYGRDAGAVGALTDLDRARLQRYLQLKMVDLDNEFYQYEHGYLDAGFFELATTNGVKKWAPRWRAFGISERSPKFKDFVDKTIKDEEMSPSSL